MATIQIRIDDNTKKNTKKILDKIGLDMSSAIKLFLKQIQIHEGIPFPLLTKNGMTKQEENEILKIAEDAKKGKNVSKAMSGKEAIEFLKKL